VLLASAVPGKPHNSLSLSGIIMHHCFARSEGLLGRAQTKVHSDAGF
jgi:hypothetical protein